MIKERSEIEKKLSKQELLSNFDISFGSWKVSTLSPSHVCPKESNFSFVRFSRRMIRAFFFLYFFFFSLFAAGNGTFPSECCYLRNGTRKKEWQKMFPNQVLRRCLHPEHGTRRRRRNKNKKNLKKSEGNCNKNRKIGHTRRDRWEREQVSD